MLLYSCRTARRTEALGIGPADTRRRAEDGGTTKHGAVVNSNRWTTSGRGMQHGPAVHASCRHASVGGAHLLIINSTNSGFQYGCKLDAYTICKKYKDASRLISLYVLCVILLLRALSHFKGFRLSRRGLATPCIVAYNCWILDVCNTIERHVIFECWSVCLSVTPGRGMYACVCVCVFGGSYRR